MYTESQIIEFKKMGYDVSKMGVVMSETRLEKKIRQNNYELESMKIPLCEEVRFSDTSINKFITKYKKTNSRVEINMTDTDRLSKGFVTEKQPGINYLLLSDGTKICRCCQKRKPSNFFSNTKKTQDQKMPICKDCDYIRGKTYRAFRAEVN